MSERKHSPLPWKFDGDHSIISENHWLDEPGPHNDHEGIPTEVFDLHGSCGGVDTEADIDFVIKACNAYYPLIEALESILGVCRQYGERDDYISAICFLVRKANGENPNPRDFGPEVREIIESVT